MKLNVGLPPNKVGWIYFAAHAVSLSFGESGLGYLLIIIFTLYAWYRSFLGDFFPLVLVLILGSYHSAFDNIYTSAIVGIKLIYPSILLLIVNGLIRIRLCEKYKSLVYLFATLFFAHTVLGFFFKYSLEWYLNECFSFAVFFSLIIAVLGNRDYFVPLLLETISNYVLYFYPILVLIAVLTASNEVLLFDEFEKFYFLALIPLILNKIPNRVLLATLNITVIIIKAKYTYFSSLNIILMSTIIVMIFLLSKLSILRKVLLILILLIASAVFYNYSNDFTKFKIRQSQIAIKEVLAGDVSAIPKSPRVRVIEFMLSFKNLRDQGNLFIFTGKGYGSYIDDTKDGYLDKYGVTLNEHDYSLEEIKIRKFKKAHGGVPYVPIKMGIIGMLLFVYFGISAFQLSLKKRFLWFGLAAPFYIITTFSYGLKNFIFVAFAVGIALSFKSLKKNETKTLSY
ncbi:hypothetical protein [Flagellimonas sp.]|uniref:hypothetical protein n=1 Tax=Flagellimonas sp. TaxID=2058762 RepID=UPI003B50A6A0